MTDQPALTPSIALVAYAEQLIDAKRVLVYGDASSSLARYLLERGARSVHVFDTDPARVAEAATRNTSRNVSFAELSDSGLALRDGAFDLALVENLAAVGDVEFALKAMRRLLSPRGAALIACANPEVEVTLLPVPHGPRISIDYYSLYDAVAEEFEHVRMLGQTPFVGYAIADFAPDAEPAPALDTGFVPGGAEEPEWFIALASQHPMLLDEFAIVQLSFGATWRANGPGDGDERLRAARTAERRVRQRLAALEAENRRLSRGAASQDSTELERLQKELERRDNWIEELEARCAAADARADQVQSELEAESERHLDQEQPARSELETRIEELEASLAKAREGQATADRLASEREQELAHLRTREADLTEQLEAGDPQAEKEIETLERQLEQRAQELLRVSRDLRKLEQLSRNLVRELAELREGQTASAAEELAALREQLDVLARNNASKEADLVALHWTVATLESKLEAHNA